MPKSQQDKELNPSVDSMMSWGATQQDLPQHMPGAPEEQGQPTPAQELPTAPSQQAAAAAGVGRRLVPSCCGQGKAELQLFMALCSQVWWAGSPEPPEPLTLMGS